MNNENDFLETLAEELGIDLTEAVEPTEEVTIPETFETREEVYKTLTALHGTVTGNGASPLEFVPKFRSLFTYVDSDFNQCGDNVFCTTIFLYVEEEDKTHEFNYYTDGTDTAEYDRVFDGGFWY